MVMMPKPTTTTNALASQTLSFQRRYSLERMTWTRSMRKSCTQILEPT